MSLYVMLHFCYNHLGKDGRLWRLAAFSIKKERRENMKLKVKGQSLVLEGDVTVSEGAVEFVSFLLECDESWEGYERCVRFRHTSHEDVYDVAGVVDGNVYYVPSEVLVRGSVFVSVVGVRGATRISTTETAGFLVKGSLDGGKTPAVTPDAYAQYVGEVLELTNEVKGVKEKVDFSQTVCEELAGLATVCEDNCRKSVEVCADYATLCERTSQKAAGAEISMQQAVESVKESVEMLLDENNDLSRAESERAGAESIRCISELKRALAEEERVKGEETRTLSEAERVASERARIISEQLREERILEAERGVETLSREVEKRAFSITGRLSGEKIVTDDALKKAPVAMTVSGKTEISHTPSPQNPAELHGVGEKGSVTLTHTGKNLLKLVPPISEGQKYMGVVFNYKDGGITLTGTAEGDNIPLNIQPADFTLPEGTYIVSGGISGCGVYVLDVENGVYIARSHGAQVEFTLTEKKDIKVRLFIMKGKELFGDTVYPMLRHSGTTDEFVPYFENSYTANLSAPLYSVDNISDPVCDKLDFLASTIKRNVGVFSADGTENITFEEENTNGYNVFSVSLLRKAQIMQKGKYGGYSNYFTYADALVSESVWASEDKLYFRLSKNAYPTVSDVQAFLAKCYADGRAFSVLYPLDREWEEKCENNSIMMFSETNSLVSSDGEINLEYVKDLNIVYETLVCALVELDARVSLLEI